MPLVSCPACGRRISAAAPACIGCGQPMHAAQPPTAGPPAGRPRFVPPSPGFRAGPIIAAVAVLALLVAGGTVWLALDRYRDARDEALRRTDEELVDFVEIEEGSQPSPGTADGSDARAEPPADGTYEASELDQMPQLLNRAETAAEITRLYSPLLRDAGVSGQALIRFRILADGSVDPASVEVVQATHDDFGETARRVAAGMRFEPGRLNGEPVNTWATLPIQFQSES